MTNENTTSSIPSPRNAFSAKRELRHQAERLLRDGEAPAAGLGALAPDALHLLYRMASSADSAGDALKLLHELQAHQVEIDMQQAQSEANEYAIEQEFLRYRALFDHAPMAYLVLDTSGRVIEANRAAFALLDASPGALEGKSVQDQFADDDRPRLSTLMTSVQSGQDAAPTNMRLRSTEGKERTVRVLPTVGDGGDAVMLAMMPLDDASSSP